MGYGAEPARGGAEPRALRRPSSGRASASWWCGDFNSLPGLAGLPLPDRGARLAGSVRGLSQPRRGGAAELPTAGFMNLRMHLDHVFSGPGLSAATSTTRTPSASAAALPRPVRPRADHRAVHAAIWTRSASARRSSIRFLTAAGAPRRRALRGAFGRGSGERRGGARAPGPVDAPSSAWWATTSSVTCSAKARRRGHRRAGCASRPKRSPACGSLPSTRPATCSPSRRPERRRRRQAHRPARRSNAFRTRASFALRFVRACPARRL